MKRKILVVAAHSDDEALGCAGTIARHIAGGDEVHVLFLTDGVGARAGDSAAGAIDPDMRNHASLSALAAVGVAESHVTAFSFPDNALDGLPRLEIVKAIESVINRVQPDTVYTHHVGDLNVDHRYAYEAVMTACRPQPGFCVKAIYSFEVVSSTAWAGASCGRHFIPTLYVNIEDYWEQKEKALIAYHEEMRAFPHARSIEALKALATFRGSQVGVPAAEAFVVERKCWI